MGGVTPSPLASRFRLSCEAAETPIKLCGDTSLSDHNITAITIMVVGSTALPPTFVLIFTILQLLLLLLLTRSVSLSLSSITLQWVATHPDIILGTEKSWVHGGGLPKRE